MQVTQCRGSRKNKKLMVIFVIFGVLSEFLFQIYIYIYIYIYTSQIN